MATNTIPPSVANNGTYTNLQTQYKQASANAAQARKLNEPVQGLNADQWQMIANSDKTQLKAAGFNTHDPNDTYWAGVSNTMQNTDNVGSGNTGNFNLGASNTGSGNFGNENTGSMNLGNENTGWANLGNENTGSANRGDANTGSFNLGSGNTGNFDTGSYNTANNINGSHNANESTVLSAFQSSHITSNGQPISLKDQQKAAQYVSDQLGKIQNPTYQDVLTAFRGSGLQGISLGDQTNAANAISQAYGINSNAGQASNNVSTSQILQAFQDTHIQGNGKPISLDDQNKVASTISSKLSTIASPTYQNVLDAFRSSGVQGISLTDQSTAATAIAKLYNVQPPPTSPAAS